MPSSQQEHRGDAQPGRLTGIGVSVVYAPTQLTVTWANGSSLALRFESITGLAKVDRLPGDGIVTLRFDVRVETDAPRGVPTGLTLLLPFPETMAAEVEGLASRLSPQVRAPASQPAAVRIHAALDRWAYDPAWAGLYPTQETERLLSPDVQAKPIEHQHAPEAGTS